MNGQATKASGIMPDGTIVPLICRDTSTYAAFESEHLRDYVLYGMLNDLPYEGDKGWRTCWCNLSALQCSWNLPGIEIYDGPTRDERLGRSPSKFNFLSSEKEEEHHG